MTTLTTKPVPLYEQRQRPKCPVCGNVSYSQSGVHPQCSARSADEKRMKRLKAEAPETPPKDVHSPTRYQKICPKCQACVHVRKKVCDCGHTLIPDAPRSEEE